jgi:hypothetical protein
MEPPVRHVFIFRTAGTAHAETAHGCPVAVIGKIADDGKPGTAVGAVDERVIQPEGLMLKIREAIGAYGNIGTDLRGIVRKILAVQNAKILQTFRDVVIDSYFINLSCHRSLISEIFEKNRQTFRISLNLNHYRIGPVHDPTADPVLLCQPVDKRSETNSLYPPLHPYPQCDRFIHCDVLHTLQIE